MEATWNKETIIKECLKKDFYYFVQYFWNVIIPEEPIWNWHIKYICDELQDAVERVCLRQDKLHDILINVPPGTSKSTICTVMLPAWAWVVDPTIRTLSASYSALLSQDHSVRTKDILKSEKFRHLFPEIAIRQDADSKGHYKNKSGGERMATGIGGSITGFHAHLLIVDDPINPKSAVSEKERDNANRFMDVVLPTRKVDKTVSLTIIVMQRLHENDCSGNFIANNERVKHICLPAEVSKDIKPPELVDNYVDNLLDPVRMAKNILNDLKKTLGSYGYAGQFMQTPSPDDGGIWSSKWFNDYIFTDKDVFDKKVFKLGTDWDLAYTEKHKNSASAYVTAGMIGTEMYVFDIGFKWLEFPELIEWMRNTQDPHYIEAKASGLSAKQTLKKHGIPAIEVDIKQSGDKIGRTRLVTKFGEAGMIWLHKDVVDKLLFDTSQGIIMFPNNAHNDLNDAFVQAINRLLVKTPAKVRHSRVI